MREERALRRRSAARPSPRAASDAEPAQQPEPFEKVLGHAQDEPEPDARPAAEAQPREGATDSLPRSPANGAKRKSAAPGEPQNDLLQILADADPETSAQAVAANSACVQPTQAKVPQLRPDVLPLSGAAGVALASAGAVPEDAESAAALPGAAAEPDSAGETPLAALAGEAQLGARDGSLAAPATLAPQTRVESAAPVPPKAPELPTPTPGDGDRAGEILRQLRVQLSPELRTATIQLSPPELGRISIRLRVERGELHAVVRAEKRETLVALERHVPELEATLEQIGIQARQFDLQLGFEQQGARQQPQQSPAGGHTTPHEHDPLVREHERRLARTLSAQVGGIDTYA